MPLVAADGPVGRALQRAARTRGFAPLVSRVAPPADRLLARLSRGRVTLSGLLVPTLVLQVRGARTGELREVPLACLPSPDGSFLVVGSNYGRPSHPAWTVNLLANPAVTVTFRGRVAAMTGALLVDTARQAVWPELLRVWPAYADYAEMSGRELRVFRLTPV